MTSAGEGEDSPFLGAASDDEQLGDGDLLPLLATDARGVSRRLWSSQTEEVVARYSEALGSSAWFGRSRVAGRLGCCLAVASAIAAVAAISVGLRQEVVLGSFQRTSATGDASPLVGLLDATAGAATGNVSAFESAASTFDALDADSDGFVSVNGVAMDAAAFQSMSDEEKKHVIAAHGPEYVGLANAMGALRQEAEEQNAQLAAGASPNATVMTPELHPSRGRHAVVSELYTFGAPATTERGVYDAQTPGGCFAGLRVTNQATQLIAGTLRVKGDPVSSLLNFKYKHALMDFMGSRKDNDQDLNIINCSYFIANQARLKDTPKWDNMWWLNGHMNYPSLVLARAGIPKSAPPSESSPNDLAPITKRRLRQVGETQAADSHNMPDRLNVERAALMAHFAFMNYAENQQIGMDAMALGWVMVGRSNGATDEGDASGLLGVGKKAALATSNAGKLAQTVDSYTNGFGDRMLMLQHPKTLECVLVFEGSGMNDIKDWLSNLNFASTPFCGFGQTHKGFRAKLQRMVGGIDYRQTIRRKVGSCSKITVTGHSLGGAQAELFAACVNNRLEKGQPGSIDSRLMKLPKGVPKRLPAWHSDHVNGSFIRNRGNGLCIDVEGTMKTIYRTSVIMYPCETPDSVYSHDQRWELTAEGFVVSKLSKKCIDGNVTGSAAVRQEKCQYGSEVTQQRWEHTPEGFLRNVRNGKCIDSKMRLYDCPFSDQKWRLMPSGHLRNTLSGKCLDVKGSPGIADGTELGLWPCENATAETDQLWELDGAGRLRNLFSGRCAVPKVQAGSEATPALVLGSCSSAGAWHLGPSGFLRSAATGKCLNVKGSPGTADGAAVDLDTCEERAVLTSGVWRLDRRGFIVNVGYAPEDMYKCIEIFADPWDDGQKTKGGSQLWLDFCAVNTDQKWEVTSSGFIRNVIGGRKCLSVVRKTKVANSLDTKLWIDNCIDPADPALYLESKWTKTSAGQLVNKFSRKCLAWVASNHIHGAGAPPPPPGQGVEVTPVECQEPGINPLWDFFPNGTVVSQTDGRCLDVGTQDADGCTMLALRPCAGLESQQWQLTPEGFLRNLLNSLCAGSFTDISFVNEMALLLKPCPTGQAQQWDVLATGQIRSKVTGECLDAPHAGQQLQSYELTAAACDPSSTSQLWEKIPAPKVVVDADVHDDAA